MARLPPGKPRKPPGRDNAGQNLRGESPLSTRNPDVEITLSPAEADALHAALEELLERGDGNEKLERVYRLLGWKFLATKGGTGLTGRLADIAKRSESLEEFETTRDEELGPIIEGLERPENRDP